MANLKFLKRVGYSDINTLQDDEACSIPLDTPRAGLGRAAERSRTIKQTGEVINFRTIRIGHATK